MTSGERTVSGVPRRSLQHGHPPTSSLRPEGRRACRRAARLDLQPQDLARAWPMALSSSTPATAPTEGQGELPGSVIVTRNVLEWRMVRRANLSRGRHRRLAVIIVQRRLLVVDRCAGLHDLGLPEQPTSSAGTGRGEPPPPDSVVELRIADGAAIEWCSKRRQPRLLRPTDSSSCGRHRWCQRRTGQANGVHGSPVMSMSAVSLPTPIILKPWLESAMTKALSATWSKIGTLRA